MADLWSLVDGPVGFTMTSAGLISTPAAPPAGVYELRVAVTNGETTDARTLTLTVTDPTGGASTAPSSSPGVAIPGAISPGV